MSIVRELMVAAPVDAEEAPNPCPCLSYEWMSSCGECTKGSKFYDRKVEALDIDRLRAMLASSRGEFVERRRSS
jgi:hypothetical protein